MNAPGQELRRSLEDLKHRRHVLSEALVEAAARLQASGSVPPVELTAAMAEYRAQFSDLRRRLIEAGAPEVALQTLNDLERSIRTIEVRRTAGEFLDRLLAVKVMTGDVLAAWQKCRDACQKLKADLDTAEAERVAEAVAPESPLAALSSFVHEQEDLDDENWSRLHDSVSAAFGRDLATAVARRKLIPA